MIWARKVTNGQGSDILECRFARDSQPFEIAPQFTTTKRKNHNETHELTNRMEEMNE